MSAENIRVVPEIMCCVDNSMTDMVILHPGNRYVMGPKWMARGHDPLTEAVRMVAKKLVVAEEIISISLPIM